VITPKAWAAGAADKAKTKVSTKPRSFQALLFMCILNLSFESEWSIFLLEFLGLELLGEHFGTHY
jgi:hypothetical protein